MILPSHLNTIQEQVRYLHMVKGMTIKDTIEEIEYKLRGKLPENIKDMLQTESKYWG